MKPKRGNKIRKIIFILFFISLTIFLKTEVNASEIGIYGKDYFGEEYSNGYIINRTSANVIGISSGVSVKTGKQIYANTDTSLFNSKFYTSNNTSKSEYIDYSEAARYINDNGESIFLDMRVYVWTDNRNYPWAIFNSVFGVQTLYNATQHITIEFHFYTAGHCGEDFYEQPFKGIICLQDLDTYEGFSVYSGYNRFTIRQGTSLISILPGDKNSTNGNNPFSTSGIATYPYFFGTRINNSYDNVWIEIDSTPSSPFIFTYGTRNSIRTMYTYYQGTSIEYYIDGVLKEISYCVPYGPYKLINPTRMDNVKEGYTIDGWYTDTSYTIRAENGIAGENTIKVYGKTIPKETYTITVDNDRNGHTYNSYQVFQGDYSEKVDSEGNKIPILSNIEWGTELNKEVEEGKTHGDKIIEHLKEKNPNLYKDCETADDIAKELQGKPNDGDVIREFTDIVGKYILDNHISITKGTSTLLEEKDKTGNIVSNYKIKDLEPGYYIVIDAQANEKDDAYSRYLIDVVQDVTMEPKTSIPKLKKKVIGNNVKTKIDGTYVEDEKRNTATYKTSSENYKAEDYDIEFELKSYIPNPDGYNTYKFEIVDILAKGFDLDSKSIKVMLGENKYPKTREKVIIGNEETGEEDRTEIVENYTIKYVVITAENYADYQKYFEEEGKQYSEGYAESQYGKTLILIEINDLIGQIKDEVVTPGQDVFVKYNAKLNGKGEVGKTPNINEAYLKYSNTPYNNDQITQTTTQTTYTYTIDLDLRKIAELKPEINEIEYLEGAEFEIYNEPDTVKDRDLIATTTTDELGQALYSSLGAGVYYLKEIKSPEGYNKLREEIEIEITATCDELGTITWNASEKNKNDLVLAQIGTKEIGEGENKISIPIVKLQVENKSGFELPVTGGEGIIIFIIIGLCIMLIAIISLKSNNKK